MKKDLWLPALWGERKGSIDPFGALRQQMDELFNDWSGGLERLGGTSGFLAPSIDVSETAKELTIKADLPGVAQKDIDVTVSRGQLTIKAEKKSEAEETSDDKSRVFHRVERTYGSFQRCMALPFEVDAAKITASFKDGVLTLSLPKPPEAVKDTKKIEIKSAA